MKKITLLTLIFIAIIIIVIIYAYFAVQTEKTRNPLLNESTAEETYQLYVTNNPLVKNRLTEGSEEAKVTITAILDLESESSKQFYEETIKKIREEYIKTGQVKLNYKYYVTKQDKEEKTDRYIKAKAIYCYTESKGTNITQIHQKIMYSKNTNTIEINKLNMNYNQYLNCIENQEPKQLTEDIIESEQYRIQAPSLIIGINNQDTTVLYGQPTDEILRRTIRNQQIKMGI